MCLVLTVAADILLIRFAITLAGAVIRAEGLATSTFLAGDFRLTDKLSRLLTLVTTFSYATNFLISFGGS